MPINSLQEKMMHELGDIYDAENQFLKGQEEMLQNATDANLQAMITKHIAQTREQIANLEEVFKLSGQQPERVMCDAAKGLVSEAQKAIKEVKKGALLDCAIGGAASKVEHYEISSYRGLIAGAEMMGKREIAGLLQHNLQQEEETARLIEASAPALLQKAMAAEGLTAGARR